MAHILVVDDDPDIVQILKLTLKSRGYDVSTAGDGEEGLRMIRAARPDLLLLDLMMPRMSGLEVVRRLRENPETRDIPIIVLSAIGEKTGKPEEFWRLGLGTDDFISKPFDQTALLGRIECVLRQKEYVSSGAKAGRGEGAAAVPRTALRNATPREVVRCFVEAWNSQNFGEEWACLSETMRGSVERDEYIFRRRQAYAEEGASPHRQAVVSVVEQEIAGETARVVVDREDTYDARRKNRRRELYSLQKTPDGWQIATVRVVAK